MLVPFQRILFCYSQEQRILLAAAGNQLFSFHASDGRLLSKWSQARPGQVVKSMATEDDAPKLGDDEVSEPPGKRQKVSHDEDVSDASSAEIVTENGKKRRRRPKPREPLSPSVINLCGTKDGKYVVAVTAEDKCLHVLELLKTGELQHRSNRTMPKRPSALALTTDQYTVLCADKFGDVYSLPILPPANGLGEDEKQLLTEDENVTDAAGHAWKPAASALTVHSAKNREALRQQQSLQGQRRVERKKIEFAHQLLLGHVSLLTDIVCVTLGQVDKHMQYIITADRDEHIRVSRGLPQPHIIEQYCFGHTQFVSKLCCPPWRPDVLISGGGDDFIISWNWRDGSIRQKIDIRSELERIAGKHLGKTETAGERSEMSVGLSGIWALETSPLAGQIIVACERIPAVLTFCLDDDGKLTASKTIETNYNVLDVAVDRHDRSILCSLDTVHYPCTQSVAQEGDRYGRPLLEVWQFSAANAWAKPEITAIKAINAWAEGHGVPESNLGWLSDLYYGAEHLRKHSLEN